MLRGCLDLREIALNGDIVEAGIAFAQKVVADGGKIRRIRDESDIVAADRDRPELFDLSRTASGHVGFGAGIHQCLGQVIARMEAQMIVGTLAERCRSITRAAEPVRRLNNTLHALASLPVRVQLA